jgi:predicted DNA-binding ribbon-helix-helix protein
MESRVLKRSIAMTGRKTSVSLESEFWQALREIAIGRQKPLSHLVAEIGAAQTHRNLSSALRIFIVEHYRAEALRQRSNAANASSGTSVDQVGEKQVRASDADATPERT